MYDKLKDLHTNATEWLKFAEAKHGGLIILNSGIVFGAISVYPAYKLQVHFFFFTAALTCFGLSMACSLLSLFPLTKSKKLPGNKANNPNFLLNYQLEKLTRDEFKNELLKSSPMHEFSKFELDLIDHILINSYIASRKYRLFKLAVILTFSGFIFPVIGVIVHFIP